MGSIQIKNYDKAVSNDDAYSSDDKRRAKDLEDKLGCDFSDGCELSKSRVSPPVFREVIFEQTKAAFEQKGE